MSNPFTEELTKIASTVAPPVPLSIAGIASKSGAGFRVGGKLPFSPVKPPSPLGSSASKIVPATTGRPASLIPRPKTVPAPLGSAAGASSGTTLVR